MIAVSKDKFRQSRAGFQEGTQGWQSQGEVVEAASLETSQLWQCVRSADEVAFLGGRELKSFVLQGTRGGTGCSRSRLDRQLFKIRTGPDNREQVNDVPPSKRVDSEG